MSLTINPNHKVITDYYATVEQARNTWQHEKAAMEPHFAKV